MSPFDIFKTFGTAGIAGFLVGVAAITWVRPDTTKGSLFLIVLSTGLTLISVAAVKAAWRLLISRKPPKPPSETPPSA